MIFLLVKKNRTQTLFNWPIFRRYVSSHYLPKESAVAIDILIFHFHSKVSQFFNLIVVSGKTEGKRKRLTKRGWLQLPTWKPAPGLAAHLKAPKEARWSSAVQVKLALTALKCPFSCGQQGGMGRLEGSRYILFSMAKENLRAHLVAKIRFFNS